MAERTMVIGWDSSDFDLLAPWIEKGYMPNLKKLMDNSRWGKLSSVYPPQTANAWSTIVTGKNSGKHGIFDFMQFKPNSYDFFPVNATNRAAKDVWEILSENGRSVVVVGVPLTYPIRHVNGYMISGFMTPNESVDYSYPLSLKDEIQQKIPGYTVNPSQVYEGNTDDEDYVKLLFDVLNKHIEGVEYLARNKEWDFFMAVFNETDWCLHRFWSTLDPNHPQYSLSRAKKYGTVIRDVHVRLDSALGVL
ncbi:MAG: alkaline phosphatase family protein, partial [Nitrososphaeraceae archaeon]